MPRDDVGAPVQQVQALNDVFNQLRDTVDSVSTELNKISQSWDSFNDTMKEVDDDVKNRGTVWTKIGDAMGAIKEKTGEGLHKVFNTMGKVGAGVAGVFMELFETVNKFVPIMELLNAIIGVMGAGIAEAFQPTMERLMEVLTDPTIIELMTKLGERIGLTLAVGLEFLMEILQRLIDAGVIDALIVVMELFIDALTWVVDNIDVIVSWLVDNIILPAARVIEVIIKSVWQVVAWLVNLINDIVQAIDFLDVIPDFRIRAPDWSTLNSFARGGEVQGKQVALVGDNPSGHERITPLDKDGLSTGERAMVAALERNNELLAEQVAQTRRASYFS